MLYTCTHMATVGVKGIECQVDKSREEKSPISVKTRQVTSANTVAVFLRKLNMTALETTIRLYLTHAESSPALFFTSIRRSFWLRRLTVKHFYDTFSCEAARDSL